MRRGFLHAMIGSVGVSALLGVAAILFGRFGWVELRILLTTLTIAGASITGMACGAALDAGRSGLAARGGLGLTLVAAAMIIAGMWIDVGEDAYWRTAAVFVSYGLALAHISLLSLAALAPRFLWIRAAGAAIVLAIASLLSGMLIVDDTSDAAMRALGVLAILAGAVTIVVPILHRLSRQAAAEAGDVDVAAIDAEIAALKARIAELEQRRAGGAARAPRMPS